jgi:hypothetical protein
VRLPGAVAERRHECRRLHPPLDRRRVYGPPRTALWSTHRIHLYFGFVVCYFFIGVFFLSIAQPQQLIILYGNIGNLALGLSCWHTLYTNLTLLPPELQPRWPSRIGIVLAGLYFPSMAVLTRAILLGCV